jgi:hypothetical protein
MVADLTLFNPKTVAAHATYEAGEPIRLPVEDHGRFEPVESDPWFGERAINMPDMRQMDDAGARAPNSLWPMVGARRMIAWPPGPGR